MKLPFKSSRWWLLFFSGTLYPLGMAPFNFWPAVIISLGFFFYQLNPTKSAKETFLISLCFGFGIFITGTNWVYVSIHEYGFIPMPFAFLATVLFCLFISILFSIPFVLLRFMPDKTSTYLIGLPSLLVLSEYFRLFAFSGFPWLFAGYSHTNTVLSGWATVGGVLIVSYICGFLASFLSQIFREKENLKPILKLNLLIIVIISGGYVLQNIEWSKSTNEEIKLALIQPNINQAEKWSGEKRKEILKQLKTQTLPYLNNDLIIWPEAALPSIPQNLPQFLEEIKDLSTTYKSKLVSGAITYEQGTEEFFNSIIDLSSTSFQYDKSKLVPFGEYVPFERLLRGIIKFFDLPMSSISKGDAGDTLLPIKNSYISANICYEVVYPDFIARNSSGANLILTLSNDAWFGTSIGPKQHMQMAQMRAIENSKPVIRVTNNGITGVIDHKGNFVKTLPQFVQSELELSVTGRSGETFYNRFRSSLVLFLVVMTCIILITRKNLLRSTK